MIRSSKIIDILYPRRCPVCDDVVTRPGLLICDECTDAFTPVGDSYCMKCGKRLSDRTMTLCSECKNVRHEFERSRAALVYDDILKESVYRFKYGGRPEYAELYAREMEKNIGSFIGSCNAQAFIPIPLHADRLRERGYNQAELIAKKLSGKFDIPVRNDILVRVGKTKVQKSLRASQRQNNLKKAFKIASDVVKLNNIILVDDIYTTGSTLDAAAECLKEAGVMNVCCAVLGTADID